MRIGIDISQIVHEGTGVAYYVRHIAKELVKNDTHNEYVLFGASLRKRDQLRRYVHSLRQVNKRVRHVVVPIPPTLLDILWNRLHIVPVEWFTGPLDVFWSSDWTQPPLAGARAVTTIHDVSFLRFPENFDKTIVTVQRRRLTWAKRECSVFFCDSEATKKDAARILGIPSQRLYVIYPGYYVADE